MENQLYLYILAIKNQKLKISLRIASKYKIQKDKSDKDVQLIEHC